jgi:hypothetical protein
MNRHGFQYQARPVMFFLVPVHAGGKGGIPRQRQGLEPETPRGFALGNPFASVRILSVELKIKGFARDDG